MFKFGIMGAGSISKRFCNVVKTLSDIEVCAISSRDAYRAKKFADENSIRTHYGSYEEMLTHSKLDAVYIGTTNNLHYENMLLCLKHNVPILCEKPFTMTAAQTSEIFGIAKQKGIFVMEAMWSHMLPSNKEVKRLIKEGAIGDVVSADYNFGFCADTKGRLFSNELGGGALYDIGIYGIEGFMDLIGKPIDEIVPVITYNEDKIDTASHVILRMGDCLAHVHSTITAKLKNDAYIYGTKGMIHMRYPHSCREFTLILNDGTKTEYSYDFNDGFEFEIEEAVKCIRGGQLECEYITHAETLRCAEIFDFCLKDANS